MGNAALRDIAVIEEIPFDDVEGSSPSTPTTGSTGI